MDQKAKMSWLGEIIPQMQSGMWIAAVFVYLIGITSIAACCFFSEESTLLRLVLVFVVILFGCCSYLDDWLLTYLRNEDPGLAFWEGYRGRFLRWKARSPLIIRMLPMLAYHLPFNIAVTQWAFRNITKLGGSMPSRLALVLLAFTQAALAVLYCIYRSQDVPWVVESALHQKPDRSSRVKGVLR